MPLDAGPVAQPRTRAALTAKAVEKARPRAARHEVPDGASGLRLVVQPTGSKSWCVRFRRGRTTAKLTLGPWSDTELEGEPAIGQPLTLAAARRLAAKVQQDRALGRDPVAERAKLKEARRQDAANTFDGWARSWVTEYAMKRQRRWREGARRLGFDVSQPEKGLAARWRDRPIASISKNDISTLLREVHRRGIPGLECRAGVGCDSRKRAMGQMLSELFSWLVGENVIRDDPTAGTRLPNQGKARERVLSGAELGALWHSAGEVGEPWRGAIRLLILTGQRVGEVAAGANKGEQWGMRRSELSPDLATWTIPGARTKNHQTHVVPLSAAAREVIARSLRIDGSPYVFTTNGTAPVCLGSKVKEKLDNAMAARLGAAPPPWRLHDIRRTVATGLERNGVGLQVTEAILNHVSGSKAGVAGIYQRHTYPEEKRAALEDWAGAVSWLARGGWVA